jgi:hypothetical protein
MDLKGVRFHESRGTVAYHRESPASTTGPFSRIRIG